MHETNSYSPFQVARALGISQSTIKRWCDSGKIAFVRTQGGHRRIERQALDQFLAETKMRIVDTAALGLPRDLGRAHGLAYEGMQRRFLDALLAEDLETCRGILLGLFYQHQPLPQLLDDFIGQSMTEVGRLWSCQHVTVYEERRYCELCETLLKELDSRLPEPAANQPLAIGAAPAFDQYRLPTQAVGLALKSLGWRTISLGSNLPFATLHQAVQRFAPQAFWLSISYLANEAEFIREYRAFLNDLGELPRIVFVGGYAVTAELVAQLPRASYAHHLRELPAAEMVVDDSAK